MYRSWISFRCKGRGSGDIYWWEREDEKWRRWEKGAFGKWRRMQSVLQYILEWWKMFCNLQRTYPMDMSIAYGKKLKDGLGINNIILILLNCILTTVFLATDTYCYKIFEFFGQHLGFLLILTFNRSLIWCFCSPKVLEKLNVFLVVSLYNSGHQCLDL